MKIRIKALDTLFFRDGKPFNMREDSWATGIFPPPPSVLFGVLRSAFLSQQGFSDENIGKSGNLVIKQILLEKENARGTLGELVFAAPYDCVVENKGEPNEVRYLLELKERAGVSNYDEALSRQLTLPAGAGGRRVVAETLGGGDHLIAEADFEDYIGEQDIPQYLSIQDFMSLEPKIGIGRDNRTRVSAESELYRVGMQRLQGKEGSRLNLIVEFEGLDLERAGLLKIGGEGKTAVYEEYEGSLSIEAPELEDNLFKLYMATPALFEKGWRPSWIAEDGTGKHEGLEMRLLAAAVGKPLSVGGFDIKKRKPKPMLKAVPPGSVYYFELLSGKPEDIPSVFHQQCISDFKKAEGFGLTFLGKFKLSAS